MRIWHLSPNRMSSVLHELISGLNTPVLIPMGQANKHSGDAKWGIASTSLSWEKVGYHSSLVPCCLWASCSLTVVILWTLSCVLALLWAVLDLVYVHNFDYKWHFYSNYQVLKTFRVLVTFIFCLFVSHSWLCSLFTPSFVFKNNSLGCSGDHMGAEDGIWA